MANTNTQLLFRVYLAVKVAQNLYSWNKIRIPIEKYI